MHLERLIALLGLPATATVPAADWSSIGPVPDDYRAFVDAYGAGLVDDHLTVCAPGAPRDWADLAPHNAWAQECVRLDFAGPGNYEGDWPVGDASHWTADREDVPSWFTPGDDLFSWGSTGNGDLLFWHVRPGVAPNDWPVVLKEEGTYWERFDAPFAATLAGLLAGEIESEYLSHWLRGPHSYHL
ncbi:hypothetical protein [Dactylosporangium darangshiense]|uniref:SMI1/KNR4 family protein n=1 Tax=Dactylosporangium darangshiense TaxID=579108 RepID=A0ABP8DI66_9ACTN